MWDWFSAEWFTIQKFRAFTWVDVYYLYGIAAVPVVLWLRVVFKGPIQRFNISFVKGETPTEWSSGLRWLFPVAMFLAISMILVALARPQIVRMLAEQDAEVIDIVLALDISDSMRETDLKPSRLAAAKTVAKGFIGGRLQDQIGLVVFAGEAFTLCPLTNDYDLLYGYIDDISPDRIAVAGSAIGSALAVCINRLRESQARSKVVILLSDGESNAGNLTPITAAKLAKAFGVRVYTIAIGKATSIQKILTDSTQVAATTDENTLQQIANSTNGRFYRALDSATLQQIFGQINRLERVKVKTRRYQEVKDYYRVYLNWGMVFLLIALFLKVIFVANVLED
ncbi:MAG: VWA domain-containing protein [Runella slithyformis]|nr:MAG: VWA domain-containing protein [Runella slithyformis]TAE97930.1 MAG: VWA domain-containing protein [Runella slithyformis]TAF29954.1 MAG: VWA domain-containing protein [Runella slithyformis]TAF49070.1 MAG: VWA domain-containing protein [Runella slithyformis]TAF83565.1 MAG: VWA domain-containing protein [Runella slithyformis]